MFDCLLKVSRFEVGVTTFYGFSFYRNRFPQRWLVTNLFLIIRPQFLLQLSCALFSSVLSFAGPFFLYKLVNCIEDTSVKSFDSGIQFLLGMLLCSTVKAVIDGQVFFMGKTLKK